MCFCVLFFTSFIPSFFLFLSPSLKRRNLSAIILDFYLCVYLFFNWILIHRHMTKNNNTRVPLPQIQYHFFLSLRTHVRIMKAVHQVQIPDVFVQAVWSLVIYLTVDSVYLHLMLIYQLCDQSAYPWTECSVQPTFIFIVCRITVT